MLRCAWFLLAVCSVLTAQERLFIVHKHDNSVGFYDSASAKMLKRIEVGTVPHETALTKDGRYALVTNYGVKTYTVSDPGDHSIDIIDLKEMTHVGRIPVEPNTRPHGIERGVSGLFYVTTDFPATLLVVDADKKAVVDRIALDQKLPHMVAVLPDESKAYVACAGSGSVAVVGLRTRRQLGVIGVGGVPMGLAMTKDGSRLYATTREGDQVVVISPELDRILIRVPVKGNPARVHLTPDEGRVIVSLIGSGEVTVLDALHLNELSRFRAGERAEGLAIHPDGKFGYVSAQGENKVLKFSLGDYRIVQTIATPERPDPIVVLP